MKLLKEAIEALVFGAFAFLGAGLVWASFVYSVRAYYGLPFIL